MIDKIIEDLSKDPRLKDIKVTPKNVLKLARFIDELDNCTNCKGLEHCKNVRKGRVPYLVNEQVMYKSCKYFINEEKLNKVNHEFASNYIKEANFDDFKLDTESRNKVLQYAESFNLKKKGLYLVGRFQTGKTYFLSALANKLALENITSIIVFMPDLSRFLKSSMNDNNLEARVNELKNTDVLMLDDFGGEMMTSWLRDEIIIPIFQYRMVNNKPIFITSNLNYEELDKHLCQSKDDYDGVKSSRILERIKKMTTRDVFDEV